MLPKSNATSGSETSTGRLAQFLSNASVVEIRELVSEAWPHFKDGKIHTGNWRGLLILMVLLWGLSAVLLMTADAFKAHAAAGNRFLARLNAPLVATFYPQTYRDKVQVLLYDDQFINKENLAWPLKYAEQAEYLQLAAGGGDPQLRPKALFLDITFSQERPEDKSISILRDALCTIQVDWGVPVYLAALPKEPGGAIQVRSGLMGAHKSGSPCFTLVDVTATQDQLDGYAWTYQLANARGEPSAALAMARTAGGYAIDVQPKQTMAVDWGVVSAPDPILKNWDACQMGTGDWWPKFPPFIYVPGWFEEKDPRPVCPYHAGVTMRWLLHAEEDDWRKLILDKYLFVGAQITGLNDVVNSPVHGVLAGVHAHAMAFDNLMTHEGEFKISADWPNMFSSVQVFKSLMVVLTIVSISLFIVKFFSKLMLAMLRKHHGLAIDKFEKSFIEKIPNKLKSVWKFVWVTLVSITVSTLLLFGFQLAGFRIGYLAAMELAFMVTALEAFAVLDDFVAWIGGEKDESSASKK